MWVHMNFVPGYVIEQYCYGPLTNNFRLANQPINLSTYRGNWPTVQPVGQRGLVGEWIAPVGQQIKNSDLFINFNLPVR